METIQKKNDATFEAIGTPPIDELQPLIRLIIDSEKGFEEAATSIKHTDVAALFRSFIGQRSKMAMELQDLIRDHGDDATTSGTMAGTVHRTWLDLRSALSGQDPCAILLEAERGEGYIKDQYRRILQLPWSRSVHSVLSTQYLAIEEAYEKVRDLRDRLKKSGSKIGNRNEDPISGEPGGGLGGKAVGESLNPTDEAAYWRSEYRSRPYVKKSFGYEVYEPAYQAGWESSATTDSWDTMEDSVRQNFETKNHLLNDESPKLTWEEARDAAKDAYYRAAKRRNV